MRRRLLHIPQRHAGMTQIERVRLPRPARVPAKNPAAVVTSLDVSVGS